VLARYLPSGPPPVVTLDVCVPMGRFRPGFVRALARLPVPEDMSVRIVVCLDLRAPLAPHERAELRALELELPQLRLRVNARNVGVCATRQRMMNECHSQVRVCVLLLECTCGQRAAGNKCAQSLRAMHML
jgi:hypothetical protein